MVAAPGCWPASALGPAAPRVDRIETAGEGHIKAPGGMCCALRRPRSGAGRPAVPFGAGVSSCELVGCGDAGSPILCGFPLSPRPCRKKVYVRYFFYLPDRPAAGKLKYEVPVRVFHLCGWRSRFAGPRRSRSMGWPLAVTAGRRSPSPDWSVIRSAGKTRIFDVQISVDRPPCRDLDQIQARPAMFFCGKSQQTG